MVYLLLSILLAFACTVKAQTVSDSFCNNYICINVQVTSDVATVTVQSTSTGWAAVGFGSSMIGSDLYVGWNNPSSSLPMISQRYTTIHAPPQVAPQTNFQQVSNTPAGVSVMAGRQFTYVFTRPLSGASSSVNFVWAIGNTVPTTPTSSSSYIKHHDARGTFTLNLASLTTPTVLALPPAPTGPSYTSCTSGQTWICVTLTLDIPGNNAVITIQSSTTGWVGAGVGASMVGPALYVGYTNSLRTQTIVSQRIANSHTQPSQLTDTTASPWQQVAVPAGVAVNPGANVVFAVKRPLSVAGVSTTGTTAFVVAASSPRPSNVDDVASYIGIHDTIGRISITVPAVATTSTTTVAPPPASLTTQVVPTTTTTTSTAASSISSSVIVADASLNAGSANLTDSLPSLKYCSQDGGSFCALFVVDFAASLATITVQSSYQGWTALGVGGSSMVGPTIYLGWMNSKGGPVISQRVATDYINPSPVASPNFTMISKPKSLTGLPKSGVLFSFARPLNDSTTLNTISLTGPTKFIWAGCASQPDTPDSDQTLISHHDDVGFFSLDFSKLVANSTDSITTTTTTSTTPVPTQSANQTISGMYCVDTQNTLCMSVLSDTPKSVATITVQSSFKGWTAIGVGSNTMSGATFYVAWPNSTGGITLSQRTTQGHSMPRIVTSSGFQQVSTPKTAFILSTSTIVFSFTRPMNDPTASALLSQGSTSFIWAGSQSGPFGGTVDSASSSFGQHDAFGAFSLDVVKAAAGQAVGTAIASSTMDTQAMRVAHGVCMILAWMVFPYVGVFIARFMKDRLGHWWFRLHYLIMGWGVGAFMVVGLILIELEVSSYNAPQRLVNSNHGIIGTILVFVIWPSQVILGIVSDKMWSPNRVGIPWWDKLHWWLGRSAMVWAMVTVGLGMQLNGTPVVWFVIVYGMVGLFVAVFAVAEVRMGVVHHVALSDGDSIQSK